MQLQNIHTRHVRIWGLVSGSAEKLPEIKIKALNQKVSLAPTVETRITVGGYLRAFRAEKKMPLETTRPSFPTEKSFLELCFI